MPRFRRRAPKYKIVMTTTPNTLSGLPILLAALLLGLLGEAILRVTPWGINALLWFLALAGTLAWFSMRDSRGRGAREYWLLGLAAALLAGVAWRDARVLRWLDLTAAFLCLALLAWRKPADTTWLGGCIAWARQGVQGGLGILFGALPWLRRELPWRELPRTSASHQLGAVARGLVVAVPLLGVFGALLFSADAVFAGLVRHFLDLDLSGLVSHLAGFLACAWLTAGFLRGVLAKERAPWAEPVPSSPPLGPIELNVVIGALNLLFLLFILVQCRYLFGGSQLVEVTPGITYAEYARRGFFELVAVSVLALPVLLFADWLLPSTSGNRWFHAQSVVMILLLLVIMGSAMWRMRLYQAEYGLTELRLYSSAFMAWLALVFGWFMLTVSRGRRPVFVAGAGALAVMVILALHALNPDALIVRANAAQARTGHAFDTAYALTLGADAVPELLRVAANLPGPEQFAIRAEVLRRWGAAEDDWRGWNLGRALARVAARRTTGLEVVRREGQ